MPLFSEGGTWKTVCENNPQTREDIIRKEIRRIAQEMLNRVVDNFIVWFLLMQQRGEWNEHSINYWKSIVKYYWFWNGFHQKNSINFQYLRRKNFEGVLIFVKVITNKKIGTFLWATLCTTYAYLYYFIVESLKTNLKCEWSYPYLFFHLSGISNFSAKKLDHWPIYRYILAPL